jgi:hypothetical protein
MKLIDAKEVVAQMFNHNLSLPTTAKDDEFLVPMLWSLPGEGKTSIIEQLAEEMGADLRTVIVAQFDAGELGGFPALDMERKLYERFAPFFMKEFDTTRPTILFLDELPQAPLANLNLMAQLVNERRIGEHKLPKNVTPVCAGNPMSARAGTVQLPSQLKDRLTHLTIETDHAGFHAYALGRGFRPEITSYLNDRPDWLQKFDPAADACPSPRSWARTNAILGLALKDSSLRGAIKGQIGEAGVTDFYGYLKMYKDIIPAEEVFANPETCEVPTNPAVMYALCSNLAHKVTEETAEAVVTYIKRFTSKEYAAFFMRDALSRHPSLKKNKSIAQWVVTEGRDLLL